MDPNRRTHVWWDIPEALTGQQLKKIVQLRNTDILSELVHNPSHLGLTTDPDAQKIHQSPDYIVTQRKEDNLSKRLREGSRLTKIAVRHGDFTPLTEPYRSLGGVTVFDETLVRRAIRSRIPGRLISMENLRPHNTDKFHQLERFLPSMNKEMKSIFLKQKEKTAGSDQQEKSPILSKKIQIGLRPAEDLRSPTDGGYLSWRVFLKELKDSTNKIVRGRELEEFVEQAEQTVESDLGKLRLKNVVTLMYDSPYLGGVNHIVYSMSDLRKVLATMDPDTKKSERISFLGFLRWIDLLLTSISNVRLREINSWRTLTYNRIENLKESFEPSSLNKAPSLTYQPKWRALRSKEELLKPGSPGGSDSRVFSSQMNTSDQNQLLWRRFHRDKIVGKFDRQRPSSTGVDEWRFNGNPPWLEVISKIHNRFQAVKSELSLQTIVRKTQRKVTTDNARHLLNSVHERWKKAERTKRAKYEKYLQRKKEEVFFALKNPNWQERALKRKKETFADKFHQKKDVFRINTWFQDLKDQCRIIMGTSKPMKIVEKFFNVPWDNFNFALERLSLVLCSMSTRDLTDYQMQAAGRFVLREVLGGPENLMSRCYKFRGVDYELPFLRPGRGESVIAETEAIVNRPRNDDYRMHKKLMEGTAGIFGPTVNHEPSQEPNLEHPEIDLRGTMRPISLPVRSTRSHHKNLTAEHSSSLRQSPYRLR